MQRLATDPLGDRIMKVNHAGEHGAVNIYRGQIVMARFTARHLVDELKECQSHEERHRSIFQAELTRRGKARCCSYWLCAFGGYCLGIVTGLFGTSAIAATTVAVESVVLRHLEQQVAWLSQVDRPAVEAIAAIIGDEKQHHDQYASRLNASGFWPRVLTPVVSASTEVVIWMGMRL